MGAPKPATWAPPLRASGKVRPLLMPTATGPPKKRRAMATAVAKRSGPLTDVADGSAAAAGPPRA